MDQFPRSEGESYQAWLERAVSVGAKPHVVSAIQTLVQAQIQQTTAPPTGKY